MDTQDETELTREEDAPISIRDSLEAAISADQESGDSAAEADVSSVPPGEDTPPSPSTDSGGDRPRDAQGKFTKKTDAPPSAEAKPVEGEADRETGEESGGADKPADDGVPTSWNAQGRELFKLASPELQDYIRTREGQMQDGVAKLKDKFEGQAKFADAMWSEIAPHKHLIDREGGDPVLAVRDLLGMAALMRTGTHEQKRQLLLDTAAQFGVDLTGAEPPVDGGSQPASNPRLDQIESHLMQIAERNQRFEQEQMEARSQKMQAEVEQFAQSHPHFDAVRDIMGELLSAGIAKDLGDAYERAVWQVPEVRDQIQEEARLKTAREQEAKAKEQAEKARKASGSVSGAPGLAGNGQARASAPDIRSTIMRAIDEARSA